MFTFCINNYIIIGYLRGVAQLVARIVRDDEAGGSSPPTPTKLDIPNFQGKEFARSPR